MIERFLVKHAIWATQRWNAASLDLTHQMSWGDFPARQRTYWAYVDALASMRRAERMLRTWRRLNRGRRA